MSSGSTDVGTSAAEEEAKQLGRAVSMERGITQLTVPISHGGTHRVEEGLMQAMALVATGDERDRKESLPRLYLASMLQLTLQPPENCAGTEMSIDEASEVPDVLDVDQLSWLQGYDTGPSCNIYELVAAAHEQREASSCEHQYIATVWSDESHQWLQWYAADEDEDMRHPGPMKRRRCDDLHARNKCTWIPVTPIADQPRENKKCTCSGQATGTKTAHVCAGGATADSASDSLRDSSACMVNCMPHAGTKRFRAVRLITGPGDPGRVVSATMPLASLSTQAGAAPAARTSARFVCSKKSTVSTCSSADAADPALPVAPRTMRLQSNRAQSNALIPPDIEPPAGLESIVSNLATVVATLPTGLGTGFVRSSIVRTHINAAIIAASIRRGAYNKLSKQVVGALIGHIHEALEAAAENASISNVTLRVVSNDACKVISVVALRVMSPGSPPWLGHLHGAVVVAIERACAAADSVADKDTVATPLLHHVGSTEASAIPLPAPAAAAAAAAAISENPVVAPAIRVRHDIIGAAYCNGEAKWTSVRLFPDVRGFGRRVHRLVYRRVEADRLHRWGEWSRLRSHRESTQTSAVAGASAMVSTGPIGAFGANLQQEVASLPPPPLIHGDDVHLPPGVPSFESLLC